MPPRVGPQPGVGDVQGKSTHRPGTHWCLGLGGVSGGGAGFVRAGTHANRVCGCRKSQGLRSSL